MKIIALFLLLASLQCGFGQTDTNVIATGDWSQVVRDDDGHAVHALRGRLLVYDDQSHSAANHARVYLELQNVFEGGWSLPLEVYCDIGLRGNLHFELCDALDKPIPQEAAAIRGMMPYPYHVTLPCDSTIRLRADIYTLGRKSKPDGLQILVGGGCWIIPPNATNDCFLSATLTAPKDHPSPLKYHVWQGTLKLPKVKMLALSFACRAADAIEERWFPHVDGIFTKGEFIDLNTNATERLHIRYGPISDNGVELERTTNNVVVWRVHVRPLGVAHSKYRHDVRVRIEDDKILVTSIGAQQIFEVHALKTGAFVSRKVDDVRR